MADQRLSFEEIDRSIDEDALSGFERSLSGAEQAAFAPSDIKEKVCPIYHMVRPILEILSNFPLIPEKFRRAVKVFISAMDVFCPQT